MVQQGTQGKPRPAAVGTSSERGPRPQTARVQPETRQGAVAGAVCQKPGCRRTHLL